MKDWRQQVSEVREKLFPTLTRSSLLRHYVPVAGVVSHTLFTTHIFAPQLTFRLFPTCDLAVSNTLLFNTHVGLGFFVFFRRHLIRVRMWDRIEFSVFSSVIFNFGSLMFAVLLKSLLPKKLPAWLNAGIGFSLSTFFLSRAHKYLAHVDRRTALPQPANGTVLNGKLNNNDSKTG